VIHAAPDHNSPVTLTGRKLFYGYEGTLWSHGVDYDWRREMVERIDLLPACKKLPKVLEHPGTKVCPDYLLWSDREKRKYNRLEPGPSFRKTQYDFIYEVDYPQ
jgi:hypothetical protein